MSQIIALSMSASCTLFVRSLTTEITKENLQDAFGEIGPIKNCFVVSDKGVLSETLLGFVLSLSDITILWLFCNRNDFLYNRHSYSAVFALRASSWTYQYTVLLVIVICRTIWNVCILVYLPRIW